MSLVLSAPAKVNLYLGVHTQLDQRGYHRVDSIMVALDLTDTVEIQDGTRLEVRCVPKVDFPQQKNTAYKAAMLMGGAFDRPVHYGITLYKRIPEQSGMGGSSSDAASVILALCQTWGIDPGDSKVLQVAKQVGADVPFFLDPRPTLLMGGGDQPCEKFAPMAGVPVVVVRPNGPGVGTKQAYEAFDQMRPEVPKMEPMVRALRAHDIDAVCSALGNNLDVVACRLKDGCAHVKSWLQSRQEVRACQVTGSGSCVFGICRGAEDAKRVALDAKAQLGCWAVAARTI
ncbi:MAG: 4-(cytidine 5'-diphospho)-2-C-methyl-D-erythritol kinase [Coriobacteriales bacterium]|nr:4-(cytidine 5'-diphospho)-2-C-methyl-D-erythritol kinase [Coriobacteriales bacterium]